MKLKSIIDAVNYFKDEKTCHQYLASRRWKDGVIDCPFCGFEKAYVFTDGIRYKCAKCRKQFKATTKTFMEATKLPLQKWLVTMWLMAHKKGISSVQLSKDLGVTQNTSWFLLQRIRMGLGNSPEKQNLSGTVEIDETFVGGKNKNRHYRKRMEYKELTGRTYPDKTPVFGLYERHTGNIRAFVLSRTEFRNINRTITYNVEPGSTLMTDDWSGYKGIDKIYDRKRIDHGKWIYSDGDITTNRVENFWSHLKRGLHGTYIRVTPKHLDKYVQEIVFRFNNRNLDTQQQIECLIRKMQIRLKYKDLIKAS